MSKISINSEWCKKCAYCANYCPKGVFDISKEGKAFVKYEERCIKCMLCERLCPEFAIIVEA